ncbi:DUF3306 domain-containing protein [Herminiimonas sp.]|uniref:DUF3306 domain-containing protein n=1 Tax=Herminiimonas sp. TaxID=1926289 RepID=UPI002725E779|nr:DUF3306 domain-containing protein [Herminiimonas sp.]MDO8306606.1 DUF3306 domain-containing protein [Herminiimonas sp.]
MAADDFFARWSKKKNGATTDAEQAQAGVPLAPAADDNGELAGQTEAAVKPLPTQEDVAQLTHDSDYSAFMAQGVDESVKQSAMKKLFTNPHFNIMDGLDIYIEDYNTFEPISPALLASLSHAKALLDPLSQLQAPLMSLLEKIPEKTEAALLENEPPPPASDTVSSNTEQEVAADAILPAAELKKDDSEPHPASDGSGTAGLTAAVTNTQESSVTRNVDDV